MLRQLREFLARQLGPADRVMLVSYDGGLHVRVPFTADRTVIERGLRQLETLSTHGDEERPRPPPGARHDDDDPARLPDHPLDPIPCPQNIVTPADPYASRAGRRCCRRSTSLTLLVNSLSGVPGRKAVLHVSDGLPLEPGEEAFQFLVELCGGSGTSGFGSTGPVQPSTGRSC